MSYKARLYLSMVDPQDNGQRTADVPDQPSVSWTVPLESRDRLTEPCLHCDKAHEILWTIERKVVEMLGHFPVFNINGSQVVVDASLPTGVLRLPRDAKRVPPERATALWHSTSELHTFGAGVDD